MCKFNLQDLKSRHENFCHYCHVEITDYNNLTVDHLIPKARGGRSTKNNLVVCCLICNYEKADMTEEEYWRFLRIKKKLSCIDEEKIKDLRNLFTTFRNDSKQIIQKSDKEIINYVINYKKEISAKYEKLETFIPEDCSRNLKDKEIKIVDINNLAIWSLFAGTLPKREKIEKAKKYYLENKTIDKPLVIAKENILVDGYSRYCALKELNVNYANAVFYQ